MELENSIHHSSLKAEEIELAYAITVHKSQGSGFEHVFLIFPERKGLLSRELVYTALTRSKQGINIFVYGNPKNQIEKSLFEQAIARSSVELRKTSLLERPYWEYTLSPEKGVNVKSRIEYIIYKKLMEFQKDKDLGGFTFHYEKPYQPRKRNFEIKPDFTIELSNQKKIYWEHLGKLNDPTYRKSWEDRLKLYKEEKLLNDLVTTDERKGVDDKKIDDIILSIIAEDLKSETKDQLYSHHHYYLA
jgi:exodeoxyribonuclease V alpha subunit